MSGETDSVAVIVPILNFDCDRDRIKLDSSLSIRRTYTNEIENMVKKFPRYPMLKSALNDTRFVIDKKGSSTEIYKENFSPETADAERITLAFRLLKVDKIWMPTSFYVSADSLYISNPAPVVKAEVGDYSFLPKEEIGEFKTLWKALKKIDTKKPQLVFALSQFNRSFEDFTEEKFVDYITSFESIVFGRGTNAPSPYGRTIGIAIGMLIGKNEQERTSIEQKLNEAYETRNKVVHGHLRYKLDDADYEARLNLLAFTKECLILSLRKLLKE
jgi:hypothetical protein